MAAWAGALFGRELESGTARLVWTQGVSPARWTATALGVPAALVAAGTGLLVVLHHLAWPAGEGRIDTAKPWYDDVTLHSNGPTTVAFALCGLAAGALAGLVSRRSLAAIGAAAVLTGAVRVTAGLALPHLWPAVIRVGSLTTGYPGSGLQVGQGLVTSTGAHIPDPGCGYGTEAECRAIHDKLDATGFYSTFHPASHYWPLQLTTTALVLALTGLLTLAAFTLLRRRTA
ncbi:hypothetical protein [Streptomyces sp. NPDC046197]|uniref:hypothetical protein n=1 Tax=Streptomyces sp. NPDC046197 TaxID=3154337 RepID=UPI0034063F36